jgi:hypothetical protein
MFIKSPPLVPLSDLRELQRLWVAPPRLKIHHHAARAEYVGAASGTKRNRRGAHRISGAGADLLSHQLAMTAACDPMRKFWLLDLGSGSCRNWAIIPCRFRRNEQARNGRYLSPRRAWEDTGGQALQRALQEVGRRLELSVIPMLLEESTPSEYQRVFAEIAPERPGTLIVSDIADLFPYHQLIVELVEKSRLPAIFGAR